MLHYLCCNCSDQLFGHIVFIIDNLTSTITFIRLWSKDLGFATSFLLWELSYLSDPVYTYSNGLLCFRTLFRKYKIDHNSMEFPEAVQNLYTYLKRGKKLGFESITSEIDVCSLISVRRQQFHWALSPDLAHYVHDLPAMYWGFGEDHSDIMVKQEPVDEVW